MTKFLLLAIAFFGFSANGISVNHQPSSSSRPKPKPASPKPKPFVAPKMKAGWYTYDESKNAGGKCKDKFQCDGLRICKNGACDGQARPGLDPQYEYFYHEYLTQGRCAESDKDPTWVNRAYYCDGNRECTNGKCTGKAR